MEKTEWIIGLLAIVAILQAVCLARLTSILGCLRALLNQAADDEQTRRRIEQHTLNTARAATYVSSPLMQQRRVEELVAREYWEL